MKTRPQKKFIRGCKQKMNWYKTSQEIYRGDPSPIDINDFDIEYGTKVLGRDLGMSASGGPGIYFVSHEDIASMYGSNITKKNLHDAKIVTQQSPRFSYQQISKILQGVNQTMMTNAASNWDEDYNKGKHALIQSIVSANNPIDQLMNIWADVFFHQQANAFVDLMTKNGIDGYSLYKKDASNKDATYYVIYNRNILK